LQNPTSKSTAHAQLSIQVFHTKIENLSKVQQQLLRAHYRLGHLGFEAIQALARSGILPKHLATCPKPICSSCQFGKAHRTAIPTSGLPLDANHLRPGDCVSVDQLESNTPGCLPTSRGTPTKCTFQAATLFCDHASRFLHLTCNISTVAEEALLAKLSFEREAALANVRIRKSKADNGIFHLALWKTSCELLQQTIEYCGVNAHHQNGIAKRQIRSIMDPARMMLLHAMHHWSDIIKVDLWPYALKLAIDLHNHTPGPSGLSPAEIFVGVKDKDRLQAFHTFGCPVFVLLETRLQAGHKIPKWEPHSRSPQHASNGPLIMNINTGLVSPQYHVVYDDHFTTTHSLETNVLPLNWVTLFQNRAENVLVDNPLLRDSHTLEPEWDLPLPSQSDDDVDSIAADSSLPLSEGDQSIMPPSEGARSAVPHLAPGLPQNTLSEGDSSAAADSRSSARHSWNSKHSHNTRFRKKVLAHFTPVAPALPILTTALSATAFIAEQIALTGDGTEDISELNPFSFLAADTTDNLHYGQMLKDPYKDKFEAAMQDEITVLFNHDSLSVVEASTMPPGSKPLSAVRSFRKKRLPCWTITKWKSRLCPHGGQQIAVVNFWHTHAPVVKWSTVRLTLILTTLLGYQSRQVDFIQAFSQADIDCNVYMKIPRGFLVDNHHLKFDPTHLAGSKPGDYVLKLNKNLYGLRQAGYNWHEKLKTGLFQRSFRQSIIDPCLFLRSDCILVVYIDDCLIFSKYADVLDALIHSLSTEFILTVEGDVGAFLGIDIKHHLDGKLELTQPGLINKIITECGLQENLHTHNTPAESSKILQRDSNGALCELAWNYRSIMRMLMYLSVTTCPDIAYSVHQCARFSTAPKCSHELAVRRIVRYLKGTATKGYFLNPSTTKTLDCYVDANFAGNWTPLTSQDPSSVKSRTGYVILFANCPLLWASKLQTEAALSTTEAECIALSQAMRDLIPLRALLQDIISTTNTTIEASTTYSRSTLGIWSGSFSPPL